MIVSMAITNFRSVLKTELTFSKTGLDVLVGANGSGKTNIVRALEFVSNLHAERLAYAIARQGGQRSLLPKSVPFQKLRGTKTTIQYELDLDAPDGFSPELHHPVGVHEIGFRLLPRNEVRVDDEQLWFSQPLSVAECLVDVPKDAARPDWSRGRPSRITFKREPDGRVGIRMHPRVTETNVGGYIEWFGLPYAGAPSGDRVHTRDQFFALLEAIQRRATGTAKGVDPSRSMLEYGRLFFALAAQVNVFRQTARDIRRFDLQLDSLRGEQQATSASQLSGRGDNLPAVVRWIKGEEVEEIQWGRILSTLRDIAPYVYDVGSNVLSSGKEYVEFLETRAGRPVESWDASDGALRALAMLIALETHPPTETLILEEPERVCTRGPYGLSLTISGT